MKIAINGRPITDETEAVIRTLFDTLSNQKSISLQIQETFFRDLYMRGITPQSDVSYTNHHDLFDADFVLSIGGDGTLLETVTQVGQREIPIVGINVGRLGFLATVPPGEVLPTLEKLTKEAFSIEERVLIHVESSVPCFGETPFGLNDFVVTKTDIASMIVVHTWLNGEFLNSYWADGLVVSTPTGSTGYSLSVGGPVLPPTARNFIISPISPHNLNVRPMVVEDTSEIIIRVESRSENCLVSLDSRSKVIPKNTELRIKKEKFSAKIVRLDGESFLGPLRSKLNWGLDTRRNNVIGQ